MRFLALLPLLVAAPVLLPTDERQMDAPAWLSPLPDWFFGVTIGAARWQWLALALLLAVSGPFASLVRKLLQKLLETRYGFLGVLKESDSGPRIERAASLLIATFLWSVVLPWLELPDRMENLAEFLIHLASILGLVWLAYGIWDAICDSLTQRASTMGRRTERLLIPFTRKLVQTLIFIGGGLIALASFGVNVTGVVAGLGVGGLILALAAKDSVENIFGSLTILFDMPFAIGDFVKIGEVEGVVEEINLRSTRIRTMEDSVVTLPNSNLIRAAVDNLGARRHNRVRTVVAVNAQLPAEQVRALIERMRQIILDHPKTRKYGFQVAVRDMTVNEVQIGVNCYVEAATTTEEMERRGELLLRFKEAAESMGIETLPTVTPVALRRAPATPESPEEQAAPAPSEDLL
jgi:MscS family membrane protein